LLDSLHDNKDCPHVQVPARPVDPRRARRGDLLQPAQPARPPDEQRRGAAALPGRRTGIGYWDAAVCATSVEAIVQAIRYTADKIGVAHVALGSDFNGAVHTPFDASGLAQLTEGLLAAGFSQAEIAAIMGGNVQRLLLANLPPG